MRAYSNDFSHVTSISDSERHNFLISSFTFQLQLSIILNFRHLKKSQKFTRNCTKGRRTNTTSHTQLSLSYPRTENMHGVLLLLLLFFFPFFRSFETQSFHLYEFAVSGRRQHEGTKIHYFCCACRTNHTRISNGNLSHT